MKTARLILLLIIAIVTVATASNTISKNGKYKCMIQMTNYTGEEAYVVISLLNPKGEYEKTLYVCGDDDEWYYDMSEWWAYFGKKRYDIDAITGASIDGGERKVHVLDIDESKINTGYKIRFETAVEDREYHADDVEFELTTESVNGKHEGKGYIRYIRMVPQ